MQRIIGGILVFLPGMMGYLDGTAQDKLLTPTQQYQALLQEQQELPDQLSKAKSAEERKKASARFATLPRRFLELAVQNPKDPIAIEALIQTVTIVNGTAFPPGGKDSPGYKALAILQRDHLRSDILAKVCQQVSFGFHKSHETFLRSVLESNPHREVQGLACLSLAPFLNDRLYRLRILETQDKPDLVERYYRVFAKEFIQELQKQDREMLVKEIETLFGHAAEKFGDLKIPVTYFG